MLGPRAELCLVLPWPAHGGGMDALPVWGDICHLCPKDCRPGALPALIACAAKRTATGGEDVRKHPDRRRGLSHLPRRSTDEGWHRGVWRGGRYCVVNQESSGMIGIIVWVITRQRDRGRPEPGQSEQTHAQTWKPGRISLPTELPVQRTHRCTR
jgi:hypothetical protein